MSVRRRTPGRTAIVVAVAVVLVAAGASAASALARTGDAAASAETDLAPLVAAWPAAYTVTGTKAEPLYTERISATREGTRFGLRIETIGQGDTAMGTQQGAVAVADGTVRWLSGCTKPASECAADPALRGFLATAAILALAETGRLPEKGIARTLHGASVVCIDDGALHPNAAPAVIELDPCVDPATGAVLGHWSPASQAFVGPTLAAGFRVKTAADTGLLPPL